MSKLILLSAGFAILLSCGSSNNAQQGSANERSSGSSRAASGSLDDKKITCVSQGGFLVPADGSFNCRLSSGSVVSLWSL